LAKPFKRYFTKPEHIQNGKGSWRRETQVSEEEFATNWERIFGKKPPTDEEILAMFDWGNAT
jgi:hypothetical protein